MDRKDIIKWYEENGMEYIPEDWGPRNEVGESLSNDHQGQEKGIGGTSKVAGGWFGANQWQLESGGIPFAPIWPPRTPEEQEYVEALDEFFTPYLARLPLAKANVILAYLGERKTQAEIGATQGITQQGVSKELRSAVRQLTRLVALDDPDFTPPRDARRRDYRAEADAAGRVLNVWWHERFATPLVGD